MSLGLFRGSAETRTHTGIRVREHATLLSRCRLLHAAAAAAPSLAAKMIGAAGVRSALVALLALVLPFLAAQTENEVDFRKCFPKNVHKPIFGGARILDH